MVSGLALDGPGAKGGFDTAAVVSALLGLVTLIARLRRERSARNALLVVAASLLLLMAFTIHAAPVLGGLHDPIAAIGIHPAMSADAVVPADVLRLAAAAVLLAFGVRGYWRARAEDQRATVRADRERIASELHDSLAQDLAIIAVHAQRLETELGIEHPLAVASRGALAASRGVIADLAATDQPTAEAALRQVAAELSARFRVRVVVRAGDETGEAGKDLAGADREQLVRIAREAIVNAARHGRAQTITVLLDRSCPLRLVVTDDGCGINGSVETAASGFGLTMMRARAGRLGASLSVRAAAAGGTEVEVLGR